MKHDIFYQFLDKWEQIVVEPKPEILDQLLDDDVIFYSPVVYTPQKGKLITGLYLNAAGSVLHEGFSYRRKIVDGLHGVLEFTCQIDDITVEGVDMIQLNEKGKIIEFKVLIRPLKAVHKVHEKMGEMLQKMNK